MSITLIIVIIAIWTMWPSVIGAVFVPTPMDVVGKMLEIADVNENDTLIDLGSGDGRIILEAAKAYDANSVGIEADPFRVFWSRSRIRSNDLEEKVEVIWGNFFRTDCARARRLCFRYNTYKPFYTNRIAMSHSHSYRDTTIRGKLPRYDS